MTEPLANDRQGPMQCVIFTLEDETFAINPRRVQQVPRIIEAAPVAGAPHCVGAIIKLHGTVVSVNGARTRFGLPQRESTPMTRISEIEAQQRIGGILADSVAGVVDTEASELETAPNVGNEATARYLDGIVSRDHRLLILADPNRLLAEAGSGTIASL